MGFRRINPFQLFTGWQKKVSQLAPSKQTHIMKGADYRLLHPIEILARGCEAAGADGRLNNQLLPDHGPTPFTWAWNQASDVGTGPFPPVFPLSTW